MYRLDLGAVAQETVKMASKMEVAKLGGNNLSKSTECRNMLELGEIDVETGSVGSI